MNKNIRLQKNGRNKGFTLIETIVAISLLAGGLIVLANAWSSTYDRLKKTQLNFEMTSLLSRKMSEIEMLYRGKSLEGIPDEQAEEFGDAFPQYSWKLKSKKLEIPDLSSLLTSKDGGADQMLLSLTKQLFDGLSKAVKEVTVSITYTPTGKAKPLEHSVTTYFVDFDKEINFGVPSGGM